MKTTTAILLLLAFAMIKCDTVTNEPGKKLREGGYYGYRELPSTRMLQTPAQESPTATREERYGYYGYRGPGYRETADLAAQGNSEARNLEDNNNEIPKAREEYYGYYGYPRHPYENANLSGQDKSETRNLEENKGHENTGTREELYGYYGYKHPKSP